MKRFTISQAERREWMASWQIPLIAGIGIGLYQFPSISLGVLMSSIEAQTGWTRLQISSGAGIVSVVTVILSPFMGHAIDRMGARRIALPGLVFFCCALAGLSLAGSALATWWAAWSFIALAAVCIKATVWTSAVISRFEHSRGLALAVTLSGGGVASFCVPFVATLLEQSYGWQGAYIGLAAIAALVSLPAAWFAFFDASDERRRRKLAAVAVDRFHLPGLSPRDVFRSRRFIQMAFACVLVAMSITALGMHFVPMLKERGLSPLTAAAAASGIGLATIVGRLSTGLLLDRYRGSTIGFIAFSLPMFGCALLLLDHGAVTPFAVGVIVGLAGGAEFDVIAYLTARYFGLRHYGLYFGTMAGLVSLGAGIGPMLGAAVFDLSGNYDYMLMIIAPLFVLSGVLVGTLGPYPERAAAPSSGAPAAAGA